MSPKKSDREIEETESLGGRVAFITGGNRGVGFDTARELGRLGFVVVLGVRDEEKGQKAVRALESEGIDAEAILYDARLPAADRAVFDHLASEYGKLDVLVNNAAVRNEPLVGRSVLTVDDGVLEDTFAVNVFAVVRLTRRLLPLLEKAEAGRIVNVSSILGSLALQAAGRSPLASTKAFAYNASKTALNAFTIHLADALEDTHIKVNSAYPGWVKTALGGPEATDDVTGSGSGNARLATLDTRGPSGGFFQGERVLPW